MQVKRNIARDVNENGENKSLNRACISCSEDFPGDTAKTSSKVLPGYYLNSLFFSTTLKGKYKQKHHKYLDLKHLESE